MPPVHPPHLVIGLTGGIAAGKSTAARMLARLGCRVIDADLIGHLVIGPGEPAAAEIAEHFGAEMLGPGGGVDRARLGAAVFARRSRLEDLNRITHPRIRAEVVRRIRSLSRLKQPQIVILEAALLLQAGWEDLVDSVIEVHAPDEVRLERLLLRSGGCREEAVKRMASQRPAGRGAVRWRVDGALPLDEMGRRLKLLAEELQAMLAKQTGSEEKSKGRKPHGLSRR